MTYDPDAYNQGWKEGWNAAIVSISHAAMKDRRGDLAKSCGYVPTWQKVLCDFGDEVDRMYKP